jgi:Ran-binding protein 3
MAYASTSSPFASLKGKNVFTSTQSSTPSSSKGTPSYTPVTSPSPSPFVTALGESSSSSPTPAKRSGFEAFASSASPFTTAAASRQPVLGPHRAKSPPRRGVNPANVSAFSAYASSGKQGFALPLQKRARAGSPGSSSSLERNSTVGALGGNGADSGAEDGGEDNPSSFGERLRAGKDDEEEMADDGLKLTEQEGGIYLLFMIPNRLIHIA